MYSPSVCHFTPPESGEYIVEAGPEGLTRIFMYKDGYYKWENGQQIYVVGGYASTLLEVVQWGDVKWQDMTAALCGCSNMHFSEGIDTPDLSQVTSFRGMFSECTSFNEPLNHWDMSKATITAAMFFNPYCRSVASECNGTWVTSLLMLRALCYVGGCWKRPNR